MKLLRMFPNLTILYASETGTAQDIAENIWKTAKRHNIKCMVSSLDEYKVQCLPGETLVLFVISTTGQGDVPTNMRTFWKFLLRKDLPLNSLAHMRYCILGLGDSSYKKFNFAARKLQKRLLQIGATEFMNIGLANDQDEMGIDTVVEPFVRTFFEKFSEVFNVTLTDLTDKNNTIIERYDVQLDTTAKMKQSVNNEIFKNTDPNIILGKIIENIRTTSEDHFQEVRLIKFNAENLNYEPGDIVYVRPKNASHKVQQFFFVLEDCKASIDRNIPLYIHEKEIKVPNVLKQELCVNELVKQYWDLNRVPTRSTIQNLAIISDNELEKTKLMELSQPGGLDDLYNYVNRPRRTILEVLADFPHTTKNLNEKYLFEIMSPIKPRAFSIASSLKHSKNEIHLLVAVVKYKTMLAEPRTGLCSNWLASMKPDDEILFWIQKGTFKFDHEKPMILIGPGTGVAPFRSLLFEKAATGEDLSNCVLFFGCRRKSKDYHCREEFEMLRDKHGLKLFCAFSRDQEEKVYVQHIIKKQSQLCWDFLQKEGKIYLAGSSKNMPSSVREEFVNIAKYYGNMSSEEADNYVKVLENSGRYQTETWE